MLSAEERTNYPLTVSIDDHGAGFSITAQAAQGIDPHAICTYLQHALEQLVNALERQPQQAQQRSDTIDILPPAEKQQLLEGWNQTEQHYQRNITIHGLFEAQAQQHPQATALVYEGQTLSYGDLNARANRVAHYLKAQGIGTDALVGICTERSLEMVIGLFGILKAGAAYVPLDPAYPAERLGHMLTDAAPKVILTQTHLQEQLRNLLPQQGNASTLFCLDSATEELQACPASNPSIAVTEQSLAYVIYTSGSTGKPKGVGVGHGGIRNRLQWMQEAYALTAQDRILQKTPYSFDVSVWEFFWPLAYGATMVIAKPGGHQDPHYLAGLIREERISTLHFVPPMLDAYLGSIDRHDYPALRQVFCSGQALPTELQQRFHAHVKGVALHNLYGPTEASVDVTYWACREGDARHSVPIGYPIANTQIHILDRHLNPAPLGVAGELYIAGEGLARGYLNRPELTAEKFIPNPHAKKAGERMYSTGDLARYLEDGSIDYLGRIDHQVKIRGFRIELGEIEAVLAAQEGITNAIVMARGESADMKLVAYVTGSRTDAAALKSALKQSLPEYMIPSHIVELESIPLTPNGKVDRKALPEPEQTRGATGYVAPVTETQEKLCAIWSDVLKIEKIGIHDNFFDLGGHSLLGLQAISRVNQTFSASVSVEVIFQSPTIASLAALIDEMHFLRSVKPSTETLPEEFTRIRI